MSIAEKLLTIAENQQRVYEAGKAAGGGSGIEGVVITDGRTKLQYFYNDLVNWEDKYIFDEENYYYEDVGFAPIGEVPFPKGTQHIVDFSNFALLRGTNPNSGYYSPDTDDVGVPATAFTGTLDVSNATSLRGAFSLCTLLKNIGNIINTSKVEDWSYAFQNCQKLKSICELDLSSAVNTNYMFAACAELENVSLVNLPPLGSYQSMFSGCKKLVNFPSLDFSKTTTFNGLFAYCSSLVTAPISIGISNAANMNINNLFSGCTNLKTVPCITVNATTSYSNAFANCPALENITFEGTFGKTGLSFAQSPLLTHDSLMSIINALETKTSGTFKITLGSANLAKLTDEEKLMITNKGWQVS